MLNTGTRCLGMAFILKAMPNIDHLGILFQELRVEGSKCIDVISRLLLISPHTHIVVDAIFHLRVFGKKMIPILSQLRLSQAGRVRIIANGFSTVGINFLVICCTICGQAIDLQLHLVLGALEKTQVQQAQNDLK